MHTKMLRGQFQFEILEYYNDHTNSLDSQTQHPKQENIIILYADTLARVPSPLYCEQNNTTIFLIKKYTSAQGRPVHQVYYLVHCLYEDCHPKGISHRT